MRRHYRLLMRSSLPTVLLLLNHRAKDGQVDPKAIAAQFDQLGLLTITEFPDTPTQIPDLIRNYATQIDFVAIGGGDGTLNAALTGLVDTQIPLLILPLGTANDLARTLNIPNSLPHACQLVQTGQTKRIDLGWVNGHYFLNVASIGFSVDITQQLSKALKQRWGTIAYAIAALKAVSELRTFRAELRIGQTSLHSRTIQVAVGNGRFYGGGLTVAANATIDDQNLDIYSLEINHWWELANMLPALWFGHHLSLPNVRYLQEQTLAVVTNRPLPVNTDGEILTHTPAEFRLIPRAIKVMVPGVDRALAMLTG
jgi:diacylglycerol kinase (ATP)